MKFIPVLGYITVPTIALARQIAKILIEERLVACANILPGTESMYWWEGKVQKDKEVFLLIKTSEKHTQDVIDIVQEIHSYECPCITFLPFIGGSKDFFAWMQDELYK